MPVIQTSQELFHVIQDSDCHILGLTIPDGMDSMEIDKLIDNILARIAPNAAGRWIADLSGVQYMGSSLLGLMVNLRERIRLSGGKLILCGVSPSLAKVFRNCCLERLFTFARSRHDAMVAVRR